MSSLWHPSISKCQPRILGKPQLDPPSPYPLPVHPSDSLSALFLEPLILTKCILTFFFRAVAPTMSTTWMLSPTSAGLIPPSLEGPAARLCFSFPD